MGQDKANVSRNKISSSYTKEEINCQTNKLYVGKDILKTLLARVLINKINYPQTKEEINYQSKRSIMRKYILETYLAGVLRTKLSVLIPKKL